MMNNVVNDFYVEDESPDEIRRSLKSGVPVIVIPSRLRRDMRVRLGKLLKDLSDDLGRAAERVGTVGTTSARLRPAPRPEAGAAPNSPALGTGGD